MCVCVCTFHHLLLPSPYLYRATFPTGPERILPAGKMAVQELIAGVLIELGTLQNFAVYLVSQIKLLLRGLG